MAAMDTERLEVLTAPEKNQPIWIIVGYLMALTGGFLEIIMGYLFRTMKKTLPNGERVYAYTQSDRNHGVGIMVLGVLTTTAFMLFGSDVLGW